MLTRLRALFVIALTGTALSGLAFWNYLQLRKAAQESHRYWAERTSGLVAQELPRVRRWFEAIPPNPDAPRVAREAPVPVVALYLTDAQYHETGRWISSRLEPKFAQALYAPDPRLVALHLKALETRTVQQGPIFHLQGKLMASLVRPLDRKRTLAAVVEMPEMTRILQEESRHWGQHAFVYDESLRRLYGAGEDGLFREALSTARGAGVVGERFGTLPLPRNQAWKTVASYYYDAGLGWLYVVLEPLPRFWMPLAAFGVCLVALILLARLPWSAVDDLRRAKTASDLQGFAVKVDHFIRGRDSVLPEPPVPYGRELGLIVQALRWMLPQWKKAEQYPKELGLEKKLLSLLVESLPEGILFFNAKGEPQLSNELGRVFLALQQEPGREFKIVSGVQVPRGFLEEYVEPVLTGAQKNSGKEVEVKWADGKHLYRIWVECVETEKDKVEGYMVVIRDITFRRQWEYVQEQVLSGITHDLRGPLSAVMGYIDLIKKQMSQPGMPPKVAEYARLAKEAAVRLNQMVSDILDVVRFEQGKIELAPTAIPLAQIFERLKNIFAVTAEQKGVSLHLALECLPTVSVWGDPKLLERVFDNLVSNAIKFTPQGGHVTVTAKMASGRKIFEVTDTGRGIPKEAQARVFEKFQQVRPGDRSSGYGLGLAVAKFIIEAHNGEIRVESEVGKGSTFTFWVPDSNAANAAPPAAQDAV